MATQQGAGVSCALDVFVNRHLADGTLVQVYPGWEAGMRTFHVVMAKSRVGSAKAKAFSDFLFEVFDAQHRPGPKAVVGVRARRG